jgi:hypothetical protein
MSAGDMNLREGGGGKETVLGMKKMEVRYVCVCVCVCVIPRENNETHQVLFVKGEKRGLREYNQG